MAIEAYVAQHDGDTVDYSNETALASGEVIQLPDGRAGVNVVSQSDAGVNATLTGIRVKGIFTLPKSTTYALLMGGRVYWDHSANVAHFKKVNDRDFYVGRVVIADAAATDTTVKVALNIDPPYDIDILRDAALSVATGTAAAGGFSLPNYYGGALGLSLTATNEAQCVDALSVDRFALGANAIVEAIIRVGANGSTSAVDITIGVANGTSTTDADAITESVFFHIDGGSTAINAESDDGTTEVAATDTTKTFTAGSAVANRVELWIDMRDPSSVKMYVDGVRVLSATTFNIAAATGPLGLLVHVEKTSGTATAGPIYVDALRARLSQS